MLILLLSLVSKVYYAQKCPTYTDELLSSFVAKGVTESGVPRLPSGGIYYRAPIHHYLLAIPIGFFGLNYLSIRILPILLSLLTIYVVYLLGRKIAGPGVGLLAALLLSVNPLFNGYALSVASPVSGLMPSVTQFCRRQPCRMVAPSSPRS